MICRTPEDAFEAGWEQAAELPPLTDELVDRLASLLGPAYRIEAEAS